MATKKQAKPELMQAVFLGRWHGKSEALRCMADLYRRLGYTVYEASATRAEKKRGKR